MTMKKNYIVSAKNILVLYAIVGVCLFVSIVTFIDNLSTDKALTNESRAVGLLSDALADICQHDTINDQYNHECSLVLEYASNEQPNKILCNEDGTTTFVYATGNKRTFKAKCSIPE